MFEKKHDQDISSYMQFDIYQVNEQKSFKGRNYFSKGCSSDSADNGKKKPKKHKNIKKNLVLFLSPLYPTFSLH